MPHANPTVALQSRDIGGRRTTVSIGVAHCGEEQVQNYESVINRADRVFMPLSAGRNKVCIEQREI